MKTTIKVFRIITVLLCGVLVLQMLVEVLLNKQVLTNEKNYTTGDSTPADRLAILNTLSILQQGYRDRDVSKIDEVIGKTIDTTSIVILGTQPKEILVGKEGAQHLLYGDWKYWGDVKLNLEAAHVSRFDNAAYFALTGEVKTDDTKTTFPLRITGVMALKNAEWLISKLQFQYDLNTTSIKLSMILSVWATVSFVILVMLIAVNFLIKRVRKKN